MLQWKIEMKAIKSLKTTSLYLISTLLVVALLAISAGYYMLTHDYSNGVRTGTIQKFSKKGFVFTTGEGTLVLNSVKITQPSVVGGMNTWDFSVKKGNANVFADLVSSQGEEVSLYYRQAFIKFPWNGSTDYYVVCVEKSNTKGSCDSYKTQFGMM